LTTITEEKIPIEKQTIIVDERVKNLNISKCLIESLNNAGFTIEIIINSHPSDITQIIFQETKILLSDEYMMNERTNYIK
jgi:PleD family two-component response regulator